MKTLAFLFTGAAVLALAAARPDHPVLPSFDGGGIMVARLPEGEAGMMRHWVLREPSLAFGLPVYGLAALALPLHLGWTGASWLAFAGYLALATALFSIADALLRPAYYRRRMSVLPQSLFSFPSLAVPAALAFALGTIAGPVDEAMDEQVCASQGTAEVDSATAESDDTFDMTADCGGHSGTS